MVGERDSDFNHITPVGCNAILDKIGAEHPMKGRIMSHYNNIVEGVKTHMTTPSFCSKTPSGGETKELTIYRNIHGYKQYPAKIQLFGG